MTGLFKNPRARYIQLMGGGPMPYSLYGRTGRSCVGFSRLCLALRSAALYFLQQDLLPVAARGWHSSSLAPNCPCGTHQERCAVCCVAGLSARAMLRVPTSLTHIHILTHIHTRMLAYSLHPASSMSSTGVAGSRTPPPQFLLPVSPLFPLPPLCLSRSLETQRGLCLWERVKTKHLKKEQLMSQGQTTCYVL